jgi:hypothetical protein
MALALPLVVFLLLYAADYRYVHGSVAPHSYYAYHPSSTSSSHATQRIAVVTMSQIRPNSHGHAIAKWSWLDKFRYCHSQSYSLFFHTSPHVSWWRPSIWGKLSILLHHMQETEPDPHSSAQPDVQPRLRRRYDWLLWIDTDTVIMQEHTRLEDIIAEASASASASAPASDSPHLIASDDRIRPLNAGVMLLRNTHWSRSLLRSVFSPPYWRYVLHWAQEQAALTARLEELQAQESGAWRLLPPWRFNALNSEYRPTPPSSPPALSSFLIHTAGCSSEDPTKLNCRQNYERRAWNLYLAHHNTTTSALTEWVQRQNAGRTLEQLFPQLYAV